MELDESVAEQVRQAGQQERQQYQGDEAGRLVGRRRAMGVNWFHFHAPVVAPLASGALIDKTSAASPKSMFINL